MQVDPGSGRRAGRSPGSRAGGVRVCGSVLEAGPCGRCGNCYRTAGCSALRVLGWAPQSVRVTSVIRGAKHTLK
jgi:hypothetical protein